MKLMTLAILLSMSTAFGDVMLRPGEFKIVRGELVGCLGTATVRQYDLFICNCHDPYSNQNIGIVTFERRDTFKSVEDEALGQCFKTYGGHSLVRNCRRK